MDIEAGLPGGALRVLNNLDADEDYCFRYLAVNLVGDTPGTSNHALTLAPTTTWSTTWLDGITTYGDILCTGFYELDNSLLPRNTERRFSALIAIDWDKRDVSLDGTTVTGFFTDPCTYTWSVVDVNNFPVGSFKNGINKGENVVWVAPATPGNYTLKLVVDDQNATNQALGDGGGRNDTNDAPRTFTSLIPVS